MCKEYIMSFPSFYKAAYARDVLEQDGINANLRKMPPEVVSSCSTGLYMREVLISRVKEVLSNKEIVPKGIFLIKKNRYGKKEYVRV